MAIHPAIGGYHLAQGSMDRVGRPGRPESLRGVTQKVTVEIEGADKPALIAEWLGMQVVGS